MTTVLLVALAVVLTFFLTVMAASEVWKCCPCVNGVPDCSERNRHKREVESKARVGSNA